MTMIEKATMIKITIMMIMSQYLGSERCALEVLSARSEHVSKRSSDWRKYWSNPIYILTSPFKSHLIELSCIRGLWFCWAQFGSVGLPKVLKKHGSINIRQISVSIISISIPDPTRLNHLCFPPGPLVPGQS